MLGATDAEVDCVTNTEVGCIIEVVEEDEEDKVDEEEDVASDALDDVGLGAVFCGDSVGIDVSTDEKSATSTQIKHEMYTHEHSKIKTRQSCDKPFSASPSCAALIIALSPSCGFDSVSELLASSMTTTSRTGLLGEEDAVADLPLRIDLGALLAFGLGLDDTVVSGFSAVLGFLLLLTSLVSSSGLPPSSALSSSDSFFFRLLVAFGLGLGLGLVLAAIARSLGATARLDSFRLEALLVEVAFDLEPTLDFITQCFPGVVDT